MIYAIVFGALFLVYYLRKYWLSPWATYVSHTRTKAGDTFLTVKHVHWYPPFLEHQETYHTSTEGVWANERTGVLCKKRDWTDMIPSRDERRMLTAMVRIAEARKVELEELSS